VDASDVLFGKEHGQHNPRPYLTEQQYLELERRAPYKSEYHDGQMFAMACASVNHMRLVRDLSALLQQQLRGGGCEALPSDVRVQVSRLRAYVYPDVTIVCGTPAFDDVDNLTNPLVIVEVLSPSTEVYDRGEKFALYRNIPSLRQYLLLSQREMRGEIFSKDASTGEWTLETAEGEEGVLTLSAANASLRLADLYRDVEL